MDRREWLPLPTEERLDKQLLTLLELQNQVALLRTALDEARRSLIALSQAGSRGSELQDFIDVRGYAANRAKAIEMLSDKSAYAWMVDGTPCMYEGFFGKIHSVPYFTGGIWRIDLKDMSNMYQAATGETEAIAVSCELVKQVPSTAACALMQELSQK